jgi:hypothetical protein
VADTRDDAIERLRALDRAIARRGASADARARVRRRIQQKAVEHPFHARLRWWPAVAFAAGAMTMGVLLVREGWVGTGPSVEAVEVAEVASTQAQPGPAMATPPVEHACTVLVPGLVELAAEACAFGDGVRVTALLPSRLRWDPANVEVRAGELLFDVAPRPDRPLHVMMGTIDIEVVGTRFVVHHDDAGGWVSMLEGHVRTRVGDGAARDLRDGQRLDWPSAAASEPTSTTEPEAASPSTEPTAERPRRPSPTKPSEPDAGLAALLDEVAVLRREGAYREAVDRLRSTDTRRWSSRARQLVSYEVGTLLERQLGVDAEACAHWAEHRRRFPGGRHDAIVGRSIERLRCDAVE